MGERRNQLIKEGLSWNYINRIWFEDYLCKQQTQKLISVSCSTPRIFWLISSREISLGNSCSIVAISSCPSPRVLWAVLCLLYVSPSFALGKFILFIFGQLFLDLTQFPNFCSVHKNPHNSLGEHFREATMQHPPPPPPPLLPFSAPFPSLSLDFPEADNNNVKQHWKPETKASYLQAACHRKMAGIPHTWPGLILSRRCTPHGSESDKAATVGRTEEERTCRLTFGAPPQPAAHAHSTRHEWQFDGQQEFMKRPQRKTSKDFSKKASSSARK